MINTYFDLTNELILSYLKSNYSSQACNELEEVSSSETAIQYQLIHQNEKVLYTTLNKLSEKTAIITLVAIGSVNESIVVDWDKIHPQLKFPINEINISSDIIREFNRVVESSIRDPKSLKQVFKNLAELAEENETNENEPRRNDKTEKDQTFEQTQIDQNQSLHTFDHKGEVHRPNDMPDFDDELEIKARPRGSINAFPSIGDDDLNPPGLPKYPELKPFIDPLAGGGSGGMYPSADHPLFGLRGEGNTSRLGVPPGARFDDPYGEDNLGALGSGLPGNLRGPPGNQPLRGALGGLNQDFNPGEFNPGEFGRRSSQGGNPGFGNGFGGPGFGGSGLPF